MYLDAFWLILGLFWQNALAIVVLFLLLSTHELASQSAHGALQIFPP
jgi:hypothetical protein